jgi:gas vesicle protein
MASTASTIAPTSDLKTTQLYVLSSRKHRDTLKSSLQRAKTERDRANTAFLQAQQWLKDANDNISKIEDELKEAQEEYMEAKGLSAQQMAEIHVDESEDEEPKKKRVRNSTDGGNGKYKKAPLITDLLMDMAKSGQLVDGRKLHEADCDVGSRDKAKFVNAMILVQELWTEEEVSLCTSCG